MALWLEYCFQVQILTQPPSLLGDLEPASLSGLVPDLKGGGGRAK